MGKRGQRRPGNPSAFGSGSGSTRNDRAVTLRDQFLNEKGSKNNKGVSVKATDMLRLEHLESCAVWAVREAKIPSLAAFYGHKLALARESLGLAPSPALFQCQRCETILRRDINCTVRPRKNKVKTPQISSATPCRPTPNYVVYKCHFCSHGNLKKEKPRRHTKETCPSNTEMAPKLTVAEPDSQQPVGWNDEPNARLESALSQLPDIPTTNIPESNSLEPVRAEEVIEGREEVSISRESATTSIPAKSGEIPTTDNLAAPVARFSNVKETCLSETIMTPNLTSPESEKVSQGKDEVNKIDKSAVSPAPFVSDEIDIAKGLAVPTSGIGLALLDTQKRKRKKQKVKKPAGPENSSAPTEEEKTIGKSSKRKRKPWTSLKEIAESSEQATKRNFYSLPIPFSL